MLLFSCQVFNETELIVAGPLDRPSLAFLLSINNTSMRGSRGGGGMGFGPPLKNHKNIGFLSNTGPDPLKNHKATKLVFNVWAIIGPPANRHFNGVSHAGR